MNKLELEFYRSYINPCYSKYLDYNFKELIVNYQVIELEVVREIKEIIVYYFRFKGFSFNEKRFFNRALNKSFVFVHEFVESERLLHLAFRDDSLPLQRPYEIEVEHFGAVRKILVEFPDYLTSHVAEISSLLSEYMLATYTSLENAFTAKCEHLADGICRRIESILINHLTSVGKEHLMESTKLFVFQKDAGFFYFGKESYAIAIEHFKKNQSDLYSPYELLVWLLTNPLPFVKSLSKKSFLHGGKPVWQEWDKAVFRDEKKFFEAARSLYDCKPYATVAICESRDGQFKLSVAFKRADKREIVPELQRTKEILKLEFEKEVIKYSSFLKRVNLAELSNKVPLNFSVYGEFVGYALAGFFKGVNHLH